MQQMAVAARPDRLERMTNLVLVLLETTRPLSLREIASSVVGYPDGKEACRQAFERDKRALRELGIPISVEPLAGEEQLGYRIRPEDYYLPELRLDPDEEQALSFAVAAVQLGGAAGRDAVAKLGAAGEVPEPGLPPIAVLPSLPALGPLHEAVRDRSLVSFGYRGRRREIEPFGLMFKETAWYLVGRDLTAPDAGLRTFRVDRFEDPPVLGASAAFELPAGFDLRQAVRFIPWHQGTAAAGSAPGEPGEPAPAEVTMVVDARLARSVVGTLGTGSVEAWEPSGAVRLRISGRPETGAFVDWVVGLGDTAEVLGPPAMRAAVVARLEEVLSGPRSQTASGGSPPTVCDRPAPSPAATAPLAPAPEGETSTEQSPAPRHFTPPPQATAGDRLNRLLAILVYLARVARRAFPSWQPASPSARPSCCATSSLPRAAASLPTRQINSSTC